MIQRPPWGAGKREVVLSSLVCITAVKLTELCDLCSEPVASGGFIRLPLIDGKTGCRALKSGLSPDKNLILPIMESGHLTLYLSCHWMSGEFVFHA